MLYKLSVSEKNIPCGIYMEINAKCDKEFKDAMNRIEKLGFEINSYYPKV